ncbi:HAMP domain-containing sensor histidine kinase [Cyclobacterium sp. 1_MG-2023]|uniref:sensor histidine kinase n=1 Tax=Cyclobacterium sp. 1_MG-2023 TaxID=3062681 RepID=UPI0026E1C79D|nr:HAMP domain-containing sensor histidine kinase [Cyclobacterium sp. 1_MG-2023]MDO6435946.1 HAMP domain-containing sensor histidine kinase [Cyclobacterium sp. 1_MG-2023]
MKKILSLKKHEYLLMVISFLIAVVLIIFSLKELKSFSIQSAETSLITVNKSSHEALKQWMQFRKNNIRKLGSNAFLVNKTEEILDLPQDSSALISSPITSELRAFFQPILDLNEDLGVFLISPNYISVFSMRDSNTGSFNLIAKESKSLLDKVLFEGETILVPPIKSDVALESKYTEDKWHTMFLLTPIYHQEKIIAAFAIRLDTQKDFSRILEMGRIGESGESYGFNSQGKIVTNSRFEEKLEGIKEFNLEHRLEDEVDSIMGSQENKFSPCKGYVLSEIEDDQGENIYEVCVWDDTLNMGVATRIDSKEALKGYLFMRKILILIIVGLFIMGFIMINIIVNARQNEENILKENKRELEYIVEERTKELKHNIKTKDKFFSILAHDLRSPFSGLLVLLDLLLKNPKSFSEEEKTNMLEEIFKSSEQLFKLLENLLSWSRSQTNEITLNPEKVSIHDLIEVNFSLQLQNANNKEIKLINEIDKSLNVFADRNTIDTVFRNLISNAIKFTNPGGKVKIKSSPNRKMVKVYVQDNGIGIPQENLEKLFKIEEKISTKGTNNEEGTGIGLALCKEFIELNGGKIYVDSKPEVGTVFIVELPNV